MTLAFGLLICAQRILADDPTREHLSRVEVSTGITGLTAGLVPSEDSVLQQNVDTWSQNIAFGLTPNRGQVANMEGQRADEVLLSADVKGAQVYVTTTGISHYFLKRINAGAKKWRPKTAAISEKKFQWNRIDLELKGADISADRVLYEEPLEEIGVHNFYRGHCSEGVLDIRTFGKVTFFEIYPGIDWVLYSRPGEIVQHDFIVHPGADISQIQMEYKGADTIELSADGRSLTIRTEIGEVREGALSCYQDSEQIEGGHFVLEGNNARIIVENFDRTKPLVIDPPLVWSTYYGGSNFDGPRSILCDNVNNYLYVVGYTYSTNMPTQNAGGGSYYQGVLADSILIDGFIWKFTQSGVRIWATYYGGLGDEVNGDATLDQFQNLYICGSTTASNWPTQVWPGAYFDGSYNGGQSDACVLKFNSLGVRQWATYLGGSFNEYATSIASDASGAIFVTGYTSSTNFPLANPGGGAYFQNSVAPFNDAFITKFTPQGVMQWSTYFGGPNNEEAYGVATTVNAVYISGMTQSSALPLLNPLGGAFFDSTLGGFQDGFVARFTLPGVRVWSTYCGGDSTDWADDVVVDGSGNAFVVGYSESTNFPTVNPGGSTYFQPAPGGGLDITISKFNSANAQIWSTYYGGNDMDFLLGASGKSICLNPQGQLYITGMTASTNFPVANPGGFFQGSLIGGQRDAIIGQFSNSGTMLWSTYFGADVPDFGSSITVGNSGCVFATGESVDSGSFFLANPGMGAYYQSVSGGLDDGYISKFCQPTGACCVDLNCVPASSAIECEMLGGNVFYPNQSCSTTTCSILCNICGKKFKDINKNGVQDGGEPPLSGWTVQLYYWNGPLYASVTTDSLGNYCFSNIPCGAWTVTEQLQPNWVQTYPSPNVHHVTIGTGQSANNIDFGNANCVADTCCVKPASGMIAWYPFDETGGGTANDIAAKTRDGWHYEDQFASAEGMVNGAIKLDSSRYVRVFDDPFAKIDTGSFTIDLWIKPQSFSADCSNSPYVPCAAIPILDNRYALSGADGNNGIMLYLKRVSATQAKIGLAMSVHPAPTDTFETATAPVVLNEWQHVAVSVDRNSSSPIGTFYLDGVNVGTFTPRLGSIHSTNGPGPVLDIGHGPTSATYPAGQSCASAERKFIGLLDELEIWIRHLTFSEINSLYAAGSRGKCKISCTIPSSVVLCRTATTVTMNLTVCNQTPNTSVAKFSFAPIVSGSGCNFDASGITFNPANSVLTLLPGQCTQIPVTLSRPAGFVPGNIACFCVTVQDTLTKAMSTCCSKLIASNDLCVSIFDPTGITHLGASMARAFSFTVTNDSDSSAVLNYHVWASSDAGGATEPPSIALNGLPPGQPVTGSVVLPPLGQQVISGDATLMEYRPMDLVSLTLEADVDGDGADDPMASILIEPTSIPDCNGNGVDDALDISFGTSVDANGNGFPDECEIPFSAGSCFVCGDADGNTLVTISDVVYLINYIFAGGPAPSPIMSGDADCNGLVTISDAVYLINFIFVGGAAPCAACP